MGSRAMLLSNESLYDAFLEAPLGEQLNGMTVSVFSALARLGIDPRREAERLARLSDTAAAASLESMIAQVSDGNWIAFDAKDVAKRAIGLLPSLRAKISEPAKGKGGLPLGDILSRPKPVWVWIVLLVLAGAVCFTILPRGQSSSDAPAFYSPSSTAPPIP